MKKRGKELIAYLHVNQREVNPSLPLKIFRILTKLPETQSVELMFSTNILPLLDQL